MMISITMAEHAVRFNVPNQQISIHQTLHCISPRSNGFGPNMVSVPAIILLLLLKALPWHYNLKQST